MKARSVSAIKQNINAKLHTVDIFMFGETSIKLSEISAEATSFHVNRVTLMRSS